MKWNFLDTATVEAIHDHNIQIYGGSPGLRDRGLLESTVLRAENKATYDPEATIASVAASMSFGLIKNHAFIDGTSVSVWLPSTLAQRQWILPHKL